MQVLSVVSQKGDIIAYVLTDTTKFETTNVEFKVFRTGQLADAIIKEGLRFVGTVTMPDAPVWHVFHKIIDEKEVNKFTEQDISELKQSILEELQQMKIK